MNPTIPPISNTIYTAPPGYDESQVKTIPAYQNTVPNGNIEGADFVVVAWEISVEDMEMLKRTKTVYLSVLGGLPPHFLTTSFTEATYGLQD